MTHQPNKYALRASAAERRAKHAQRTPLPGDAERRHYTRLDTTYCPDTDECAKVLHPQLFEFDCCECCGEVI
jgi:hypothetical protein